MPRFMRRPSILSIIFGVLAGAAALTASKPRRIAFSLVSTGLVSLLISLSLPLIGVASGACLLAAYHISRRVYRERYWSELLTRLGFTYWRVDKSSFEHKSLRIQYLIRLDGYDEWVRMNSILATKPLIVFKGFRVGAAGENVGSVRHMSELGITIRTSKGTAIPLSGPATSGLTTRQIALLFSKPIEGGETRQFVVSGMWPDMWAPLRETGKDHGSFELVRNVEVLEIVVVFPKGISDGELENLQFVRDGQTTPQREVGKAEKHVDSKGRLCLSWTIQNAHPGVYSYDVHSTQVRERMIRKSVFSFRKATRGA